ncbi:MAG: toll/interleukin-1 receptor domain-containing protein [Oscillibacter sp.]|nr:toll/interleukin-1 receptor domain-containing protein [Oscillibacter sp.]
MPDVFISYSHKDADYAERLYQFLSSQQLNVWYAPYTLEGGSNFAHNISNALSGADGQEEPADTEASGENLESCKVVVLLLSGNSMLSRWVKKELKYSIKLGKSILPVQIDRRKLSSEYALMLSDIQIMSAYHLDNESLHNIADWIWSHIPPSPIPPEREFAPLSYSDLDIRRIACGDPYYTDGHTLQIHLSGNSFFLTPPREGLTDAQKKWANQHFKPEETCFGMSPRDFVQQIPISDLPERIESAKKAVLQNFLEQTNGCYFNNEKYGVEKIRPFGRTEDTSETPELWIDLFVTDYYTHRVMKEVCKALIREQGDAFLSQIRYTDIGPYKIFLTSIAINLLLLDYDRHGNISLLLTARSTNAAETYGEVKYAVSVIEGISVSDYDDDEKDVRMTKAVERGLREELGVRYPLIRPESIRFYDLFVNNFNLEIGISTSVALRQGLSLEENVRNLRGKDDAIEVAGKYIVSADDCGRFILSNRERFLPQAIAATAAYLETIGIIILNRHTGKPFEESEKVVAKDGSGSVCGDAIVKTPYYIAVIDGATPKGEMLWDGKPGDVYVAQLLKDAIISMPYDMKAADAIEYLNAKIRDCYATGWENLPPEERLQASVVIFSVYRREIWGFGDCKFRINQINYDNNKNVDILLGGLRAFCLEVQRQTCMDTGAAYDSSLGRQEILPFLKKQSILANKEWSFSYDVLDGGTIYPQHVDIELVQKGDHVVLASDGYPVLFDSLEETEAYLQKNLEKDRECMYQLRGTKGISEGNCSYDDRSFISFIVK